LEWPAHADLNASYAPAIRRTVQHAYAGLVFEFIAVASFAAMLLPKRVREDYLYAIDRPNRLVLYSVFLWLLLVLLIVHGDVSRALHAVVH
jgi:hypothetical protein